MVGYFCQSLRSNYEVVDGKLFFALFVFCSF